MTEQLIHWLVGAHPVQWIPCGASIDTTFAPRDGSKATCPICAKAFEIRRLRRNILGIPPLAP